MSKYSLKDQRIFMDGYELTSRSNSAIIDASKATPEVTCFGAGWKEYNGDGLKDFTVGVGGFMDIDTADAAIFDELSDSAGFVFTITPQTQADGGLVFFMHAIESSLKLFGNVGDAAPFQIGAGSGSSALNRGVILAASAAKTATGTGTAQQMTTAAVGKVLSLALHVTAKSGTNPTLTLTIESSANVGFSTPTTLYTSSSFTDVGAAFAKVTLASTNTYFRVKWTIGGTTPSFTILSSISIN